MTGKKQTKKHFCCHSEKILTRRPKRTKHSLQVVRVQISGQKRHVMYKKITKKVKSTCEIWSKRTCKLQIKHLQKAVILTRSLHMSAFVFTYYHMYIDFEVFFFYKYLSFHNTVILLMGLSRAIHGPGSSRGWGGTGTTERCKSNRPQCRYLKAEPGQCAEQWCHSLTI